ncbi:hypothetical protein D3C85_14960 [compost metagenome]
MPLPTIPNIDTVQQKPVIEPVTVAPTAYKSAAVDTELVNYDQLTTYVAGQAWYVDFLSRIRARDDDNRAYESSLHPVYQQCKLIKGFELKVTSPLAPSQDATSKDMTLRGTANVYGVLIPNEGDHFFADIGDGREGLFHVIRCTRMTHYNSTIHEIEYGMIKLSSKELRGDIMRNVVETVVFHKDFLETGNMPLLSEEQTGLVNDMKEHYGRLVALYFHDFFSQRFKTLLVPNQNRVTYDPFIIKYLKTILTTDDHPTMRHVTEFNVQGDQTMYEFTLWNCLESMDYDMLSMSVHKAGIVDVSKFFNRRPTLNSVYYTGVGAVVYPDMSPTNVDAGYCGFDDPVLEDIVRGSGRFRELDRLFKNSLNMDPSFEIYEVNSPENSPQIHQVTIDDYYVLSEGFYRHDPTIKLSKLETLTMAALKGEPIDIRILNDLCNGAPKWDNLERFYYVPILFHLLRIYKRRIK